MKRSQFLKVFADAIQTEGAVSERAELADIYEWDSLAAVTLLALFNREMGLQVSADKIKSCKTVGDLLDLGEPHYAA